MCGIAGFASTRPDPGAARRLETMADVLAHRGPDGKGFYLQRDPAWPLEPRGDGAVPVFADPDWTVRDAPGSALLVGLANLRLAIIDLEHGRQPVFSEDRSIVAVFNGEIYNYRALQAELERDGHRLASGTDSEVLPHLYESVGIEGLLEKLDGMFAFAIWDGPGARLVLARDRLGEKPLYYRVTGDGIQFASELKGLLALPDVPRRLDPVSVAQYLVLESVPAPASIYQDIRQLEPASALVWHGQDGGRTTRRKYWSLPSRDAIEAMRAGRSDTAWLTELDTLLTETIGSRLTGDVPIGVLLSGGLDSSLIASVARRHVGDLPTFSVGFRERSFDESGPAHDVAAALDTRHHHLLVGMADIGPILSRIQLLLDEPLADGSLVPTWALAAWVRRSGVTVALSGDGGDETFGGYPTYLAHHLDPLWNHLPPWLSGALERCAGLLPASFDNISRDFVIKRTIAGIPHGGAVRHAIWMGGLAPREAVALLHPDVRPSLQDVALFARHLEHARSGHRWPESAQVLDFEHYLPNDLLVKVDRAAMASGLEVRAPLLAHRLVAFGMALPAHLKVTMTQTKVAIRRICASRLPASVVKRPKKGFGMPIALWLRDLDRATVDEWLAPPAGGQPLFDRQRVAAWLETHRKGREDNRKRLWPIVMFERWRRGPWGPR